MIRTVKYLLTVALLLACSIADAQHEPAVMVRSKLYCRDNSCRVQPVGQGNGVIFSRSETAIAVLTVAHNLRDAQSTAVSILGQWHPAKVAHIDTQADLAVLDIFGRFAVPTATLSSTDPPIGATLAVYGYWPDPWATQFRSTTRIRSGFGRFHTIRERVVVGVSGSAVLYGESVVGLVHGVTTAPPYSTLYVPASVIHTKLQEWGYQAESTMPIVDTPRTTKPIVDAQPPARDPQICQCDCDAKFAAIEAKITQLALTAVSTGVDAGKITALNEQINILRTELDALKPLLRREVILVSDGKITSRRSLKPSDPIVLGSEIVVRKNAGN